MAFSNKFISRLVFLAALLLCSAMGAQTQENNSTTAVPELPPEELTPAVAEKAKEEEGVNVVNYDDSKTQFAFFNDNSFSKGASRYLNILDLGGYFRTRFSFFHNGHLGTYIPGYGGTSNMPPNASLLKDKKDDSEDASTRNPSQNNFSGNLRLRLDPTINVSEVVRVRTTLDVFDNMVLGSTPGYLTQGVPSFNPTNSVNSMGSAIALKRAWGEASFPIGELRFGRMPFHWGLGILYNSGDGINSDFGDQVDGLFFSTRLGDHFLTPGYSFAYSGPSVRGGGFGKDFQSSYAMSEGGQRYPVDGNDIAHVLSLSFLKRDSDFLVSKKHEEGRAIYNYGIFASYRHQYLDSQAYTRSFDDKFEITKFNERLVKRDSNIGTLSLWQALSFGTFHVELEAAGIWGKYEIGESDKDEMASGASARDVWLLQGGIALESRYGFLNDRLQVGLDAGFASYQDGPGFGLREGNQANAKTGDADGGKLPGPSDYKTNFRFNPAYTVDLLMYKEVLGGVASTMYLKPHIGYFFSRNFGLRGDVITSIAPNASNTSGNSNWLGVELDASAFLRTESGFYFQVAYGVLFPLKGLEWQKVPGINQRNMEIFGDAKIAQTVQGFFGIVF